jgi:hypothetical protein
MEINITLIVQMFHFGIAYVLIDRLFLRSVCAHIAQEDVHKRQLEQQALRQQEQVDALTQQNEQDWKILQKRLNSEAPPRARVESLRSAPEELNALSLPSQEELVQLTNSLSQDIVRKVLHD